MSFGNPVELDSRGTVPNVATRRDFGVMPDGRRLLVLVPKEADASSSAAAQSRIHVVWSWLNGVRETTTRNYRSRTASAATRPNRAGSRPG